MTSRLRSGNARWGSIGEVVSSEDFESTFRALLPRAYRVAYRILGSETDAEDAAAEAFARAHASWKKVGRLPYRDAWILRVASNVAIDMARRRRDVPALAPTISEEEQTVLQVALVAALGALPRRQREVISLRWLEGFSEKEIAEALQISVGTVKKTTHRGMAALRSRLGEDWNPTPLLGNGG
jgi:RNA polymerase sigma factor (sigma-70 family)